MLKGFMRAPRLKRSKVMRSERCVSWRCASYCSVSDGYCLGGSESSSGALFPSGLFLQSQMLCHRSDTSKHPDHVRVQLIFLDVRLVEFLRIVSQLAEEARFARRWWVNLSVRHASTLAWIT